MKTTYLLILRAMPLIFGCSIALATLLFLIPMAPSTSEFIYQDKIEHALIFIILSLTGSLAYPHKKNLVYIGLTLYGAVIEILQGSLTKTRNASILDWLADGAGVLFGMLIYLVLRKFIRHDYL